MVNYPLNVLKNRDYAPTYVILFAESPCNSGSDKIYEWELPEIWDPDNDNVEMTILEEDKYTFMTVE